MWLQSTGWTRIKGGGGEAKQKNIQFYAVYYDVITIHWIDQD